MPIGFEFDPRGFAVFRYTDPYTFEDFTATLALLIRNASYRPRLPILSDRRDASAPPSAFVRQLVRFVDGHDVLRGTPVAIVVGTTAGYGMGRMQEMLAESAHLVVRTFTDHGQAVDWLLTGSDS
jgi:hypothetical protein